MTYVIRIMLIVLLMAGIGDVSATTTNVVVPATVQWVDTGITLNTTDYLKITATGSWSPAPDIGTWGPNGSTQPHSDNFLNLADIGACMYCASTPVSHMAGLIGYIGNNPPAAGSYTSTSILPEAQKVFFVGSIYDNTAPRFGKLWLNFNDDAYSGYTSDNSGQVTAIIDTDTNINIQSIKVRAYVDGKSQLIINNTVQWHHINWGAAPGRLNDNNYSTYINGYPWYPWSGSGDYIDCDCFSDVYTPASPILPPGSTITGLNIIQSRGAITVVQYPNAGNDWTAIIYFDDDPVWPGNPGADWFDVKIEYKSGSVPTPTPTPTPIVTPTPSPTLTAPIYPIPSILGGNDWIGYVDHKTSKPMEYTLVNGSWKVPDIDCQPSTLPNIIDIWVGLGGFIGVDSLEQVGIRIFCNAPNTGILPFYELTPQTPRYPNVLTEIHTGDMIMATAEYLGANSSGNTCKADTGLGSPGGNGVYRFTLTNKMTGDSFVSDLICGDNNSSARSSADWIVEGHHELGSLLKFDRVDFIDSYSNYGNIGAGWIGRISMYNWKIPLTLLAFPSVLDSRGTTFTVYWNGNIIDRANKDPSPFNGKIVSVYSPVELHAYDEQNNYTGSTSDEIPGSMYGKIGESKFIYLPNSGHYRITTNATGNGSFDLKIRAYNESILQREVSYLNVSQTNQTTTSMSLDIDSPILFVDRNGNGIVQQLPPTQISIPTPTSTPTPLDPDVATYDINHDGIIQKSEAVQAVIDYFSNLITKIQAIKVIIVYFSSA